MPRTAKTALGGLGTAGLSWLLLLGAIHAGLMVPSQESLSPLARLRALDYSLGDTGAFAALREEFVDEALGRPSAAPVARAGPAGVPSPPEIASQPPQSSAKIEVGRPPRTVVEHQFDNDNFEKAYPVERVPFTASTETQSATRQPDEPATCEPLGVGGGTVWYRYTPRKDLGLIANTFGTTYSVALAVYTGDDLGALTQIGECEFKPGGDAQVVFPGKRGTTYYFQVTGPSGGGRLLFNLDPLGSTELASVSQDGSGSSDQSAWAGSISADGRYVAFHSAASNLHEDSNVCYSMGRCADVFVRDMRTGRNELVSVSSDGEQASGGESFAPSLSGNGRFVAFISGARNLVPDDRNKAVDAFVHDRRTGRTERVSLASDGSEGSRPQSWRAACGVMDLLFEHLGHSTCWYNDHHLSPGISISSDGRYVVFSSDLQGLVPGVPPCTDTGGTDTSTTGIFAKEHPSVVAPGVDAGWLSCRQIYVHDRKTNKTTLASVSSTGEPANADSSSPFIARGGRWVAFASDASNLAPVVLEDGRRQPDANGQRDAFVHDLRTGTTELVSVASDETQGNGGSGGMGLRGHVTISDDGRWVAFISSASNLSPGDLNIEYDVFLRDRKLGRTTLVSIGPGESAHASITADGRYVAISAPTDVDTIGVNHPQDLLVYDRETRTITEVSVATSGEEANGSTSAEPEMSADGHYVVFLSDATNLDPHGRDTDTGTESGLDMYVHELPWIR